MKRPDAGLRIIKRLFPEAQAFRERGGVYRGRGEKGLGKQCRDALGLVRMSPVDQDDKAHPGREEEAGREGQVGHLTHPLDRHCEGQSAESPLATRGDPKQSRYRNPNL